MTDTVLPIAAGAIIGAVGCIVFIIRATSDADDRDEQELPTRAERRRALKPVLFLYVGVTWICLVAAVAIGELAFVVLSGIMALIATIGLAYVRPFQRGSSQGAHQRW
jgi:nitrate reductase NapE component